MSAEAHTEAKMRRQYGLVTREQALDAGMSPQQIQRRITAGRWRRAGPGVYLSCAQFVNAHTRLLAACLSCAGAASHRSAAALHGIDGFKLGRPEVTTVRSRGRFADGLGSGIIVHRSVQMDAADMERRLAIPCTGLARTLLDLAAVLSRSRTEQALDAVLRSGRLSCDDLADALDVHAGQGKTGVSCLRAIVDERIGAGEVPLSDWSRWVGDLLHVHGLPRPVFEYRVLDGAGVLVAQVDLAYPDRLVAIELDSIRWHHNRESFVNDRRRRNRLTTAGWNVLTFTWADYSQQPEALCATVARALRRSPPPVHLTAQP